MKLSLNLSRALVLALMVAAPAVRSQNLEDALDWPGAAWTTSASDWNGNPTPGGEWAGQTGVTHDGVDAARSGPLPLYHTSRLTNSSFSGPGTVTFWRRHGALDGQSPFSVLANGTWVGFYLPGQVWQPVAIDLPPGPATLEWSWYNSYFTNAPADNFAYLDEVAFHAPGGAARFMADPADIAIGEGYTIQPGIAVLGEKPMRLELVLPGASTNLLVLPEVGAGSPPAISGWPWGYEATPERTGVWTISISNALGTAIRTFSVTVTSTAPHSLYVNGPYQAWLGAEVRLTTYVRGTGPFTYQWLKDGNPLAGETGDTLTLASFAEADAGEYAVVVTSALGTAQSSGHYVNVGYQLPAIVNQPGSQDIPLYGYASMETTFDGTPPFEITVWRDGTSLYQESNYSYGNYYLSVYGNPGSDPGVYWITVNSGLGSAQTTNFVIQVGDGAGLADALDNRSVGWRFEPLSPAGWTSQTAVTHDGVDAANIVGQPFAPLRTSVEGPASVAFWWQVQEGALDFSVDGVLQQTLLEPVGNSGWQRVEVSLDTGWHELSWQTQWTEQNRTAAYLDEFTVVASGGGPVIVRQPQGGSFNVGDSATLSVEVTGTGPFMYWLIKDETPLMMAMDEPATSYDFQLSMDASSPGAYWIQVTDAAGRAAFSDDAVFSVNGDFGSLINLATAVGQRSNTWYYSDYSALSGTGGYPIRPWYRTRADGVPAGADRCARTPELLNGELAALVMEYDAPNPVRLSFWMKFAGALPAQVLGLSVNGALESPTEIGTMPGTSGESWTGYEVMLPAGYLEIQWEVLAQSDGVVAHLGYIELTPTEPPTITLQPANLTLPAGEAGALTVAATSPLPMTYQWFKVGSGALAGQTNDTLSFSPAAPGDSAQYYAEVSNAFGTAQSFVVWVQVTGPRPQITQPLQPQQLQPGQNLRLEVAASSSNGALTYRWFRGTALVQTGGTSYQRAGVTVADSGLYRVEVSDPYYSVFSEAKVTVSSLYYTITWLPAPETNGYAVPYSINNAGVVAGYAGGFAEGSAVTVWTNGVPLRLTPAGAPFSWSWSLNEAGDVVGVQFGTNALVDANTVVRWSPPYAPGNGTTLGTPAGHPLVDIARINNRGEIAVTETGAGQFGQARFSFRYTAEGRWESLGPLVGDTPLAGALDRGWATALDINNAGVIVGQSYFQEPNMLPTQATGWIFDPAASSRRRTAMDALDSRLATTLGQPWGWLDTVNDLGDVAGRRWGTNAPTKLFLRRADGSVHELLARPAMPTFLGESFNVDAMNNRRELVGHYYVTPSVQRAAIVRDRNSLPGAVPTTFNHFELDDLNDLVVGGTGDFQLNLAYDINDQGQIVGSAVRAGGGSGPTPGFLLTPVTPYPPLSARGVDDTILRPARQGVTFALATLSRNDLGTAPLNVTAVANTSANGGTLANQGGGTYRYEPPAGPDAPDRFTYTVQAADGSSATGTVRVLIEAEPLPPSDGSPVQVLPDGQVRVHFVGKPNQTYRIEAADEPNGPWLRIATMVSGADGTIEYVETLPYSTNHRFYRIVE